MKFFDQYPRFYNTTGTRLLPNRLHQRHKAIIERNARLFPGARVLDLASHDGRWSFAAVKAGAGHVTGVEARQELVLRARETFSAYQIKRNRYRFVCGDARQYLRAARAGRYDLVLCLGFYYHTMYHMELLELMAQTGAETIIIDTAISPQNESIIQIVTEAPNELRNSVDVLKKGAVEVPVGIPSREAVRMMLTYIGYDMHEVDWRSVADDWSDCEDYAAGNRATFLARRARPMDGITPRVRRLARAIWTSFLRTSSCPR